MIEPSRWYHRPCDARICSSASSHGTRLRRTVTFASIVSGTMMLTCPTVITLNYATAGELKSKLEGMLSPKGHIEVDERTNALIINDVSGNRAQIEALARGLDTQTPQITIEARIVEARSTFVRQFGVQWGGRALAGAAGGNATGLVWPSSVGVIGGNEDTNTNRAGVALPSDFAVNMPAATGTGEGGA